MSDQFDVMRLLRSMSSSNVILFFFLNSRIGELTSKDTFYK